MLIIFLLDNSASMNQRTANGLSLFDCAKSAIEHFHKIRQRDASFRMDRYMLITCDENSEALKVLDRFPFSNFFRFLKSAKTRSVNDLSSRVQTCFEHLHLQRLTMDVDKFGMGRNPCSVDPTFFFVFSDGVESISKDGCFHSFSFNPSPSVIGSELSSQINRWDQKCFVCLLKIPSLESNFENVSSMNSIKPQYSSSSAQSNSNAEMAISSFCESTGGKCAIITSWKMLIQHVEFLAARISPSVLVSFDQIPLEGVNPLPRNILLAMQKKSMFIKFGVSPSPSLGPNLVQNQSLGYGPGLGQGHWPLPENFWPIVNPAQHYIPCRDAHPIIYYKPLDSNPYIPQFFVHDIYEIEPNPLLNFLLKASNETCWQVYIKHSKGIHNAYGDPFGFLKLNAERNVLQLYVLPYDYPILFKLIDQICNQGMRMNPDVIWRQNFERYCSSIPPYYASSLRAAMKKYLSFSVVPDAIDMFLVSGYFATTLKKIKALAKVEMDSETAAFITDPSQLSVSLPSLDFPKQSKKSLTGRLFPVPSSTLDQLPAVIQSTMDEESKKKESSHLSFMSPPLFLSFPSLGNLESFQSQKKMFDFCSFTSPSPFPNSFLSPSFKNTALNRNSSIQSIVHNFNTAALSSSASTEVKKDKMSLNPFDVNCGNVFKELDKIHFHIASLLNEQKEKKKQRKKHSIISSFISQYSSKQEEQAKHYLPIEKMGDFNESLLKQQIPRNPFLDDNERNKQSKMLFGNPYKQDKSSNENANETWSEGIGGQLTWKRKRQKRSQSPSPKEEKAETIKIISHVENKAIAKTIDSASPPSTPTVDFDKEELDTKIDLSSCIKSFDKDVNEGKRKRGVNVGENIQEKKDRIKRGLEGKRLSRKGEDERKGIVKVEEEREGGEMKGEGFKPYIVTPQGKKMDQILAVDFLISIFRKLRKVKGGNSEELFQLLFEPDFPVNKSNFVRQLIVQAQNYKKFSLANELSEYLLKI